jgi:DNA-binding response OmpR family regulator
MAYLMIVDGDEDFASAAAAALRHAGHEVAISPNPATATTDMEARAPDLIILDVMFPEDASGGFELARSIRQGNSPLAAVPILMLTAVNARFPLGFGPQDINDAWLPASDFLEKPVDLRVLPARVQALLQGSCHHIGGTRG